MKFISKTRLNLLHDAGFDATQIDDILQVFNLRRPPTPAEQEIKVGTELIYKHNGAHVYVSEIWGEGRWMFVKLLFKGGEYADDTFSSRELLHYITEDRYDSWEIL